MHIQCIGSFSRKKKEQHADCPILGRSVNRASAMFRFPSWVILFLIGCSHPLMRYGQPLGAKSTATYFLPHPENERYYRINGFWFYIFGNQGIGQIFMHIPELLTALIGNNTIYHKNNTDSKLNNIANCKTCKNTLLVAESTILIRYYYQTAKTRVLCESIDGPTWRSTDNPPKSEILDYIHQTVAELTVLDYWQPGLPNWPWFGLDWDPDPDRRWRSRTVTLTAHECNTC